MANQREQNATQAASPAEQKPEGSKIEAGKVEARDADVIKDEQEAMRRARLPKPGDEPPEAKNPQVAEIESIIAAIRH